MPPDRAADSYAIYSMLMPGQPFAQMPPEQNVSWAIAGVTVNLHDMSPAIAPQGQLKPPPENPRGFEEAVGDFETNKNVRVQLERNDFQIAHSFDLLTAEQVNHLRAAKSAPAATSETQTQWSGVPGITFFSEVYFDTKHRAALVYMDNWCANLCAAGSWVYLEKHGDRWVRRSGIVLPGA
jgi:hypothetical protein